MGSEIPFSKRRSRMKHGPAYEFVYSAGTLRKGEDNTDARTIIRRQAARLGHKGYRPDIAKYPRIDHIAPQVQLAMPQTNTPHYIQHPSPIPPPSSYGYEAMRLVHNFDITELISFTDIDLAASAWHFLQYDQRRAVPLLQKHSSSFLAYLPSRYGSLPFLDDAMHCVAAKAAQMLGAPSKRFSPAQLYSKAICSLRSLTGGLPGSGSELYCATRLLALYELLGPPDKSALAIHNKAGIELIKHRGPASSMSVFDLMLLRSQGPYIIITEMYDNVASMFEAAEWQWFFAQAAKPETDPASESRLWWDFFAQMALLPGLLRDMRILFGSGLRRSEYSARSLNIHERAKHIRQALRDSHILYQHTSPHPQSLFDVPVLVEPPDRIRLRVSFMYTTMYLCRVLATFSLTEVERATSEAEAQTFAAQTLLIEKLAENRDPAMAWHLGQRNALAHSIVHTRGQWFTAEEPGRTWEELKDFLAQRWLNWEDSWRDKVLVDDLRLV